MSEERTVDTGKIRGFLVEDAAHLGYSVYYDWIYLIELLCYEVDKQRRMIEWLARIAASCLGGSDCDTYFDDDRDESVCEECRRRIIERAEKAVSEGDSANPSQD